VKFNSLFSVSFFQYTRCIIPLQILIDVWCLIDTDDTLSSRILKRKKNTFWLYYPVSFVVGRVFSYSDFYEDWKTEESYPFQRQVTDGPLFKKRNVYLPSLMMKVSNYLYVLGDTYTCHTYCCYAYYFTRIGCTLFTCDMYMCRIRFINYSVLSSLKMEGIRLLYYLSSPTPSATRAHTYD
jgi:hypothetical protein